MADAAADALESKARFLWHFKSLGSKPINALGSQGNRVSSPPESGYRHTWGSFLEGRSGVADKAILFVDGNNFYHSLKNAGVRAVADVSLAKVSQNLVGPRTWVATRYYVGRVSHKGNPKLHADQRRYEQRQRKADPRVSFHFGRLEERRSNNVLAEELLRFLGQTKQQLAPEVYTALHTMGSAHRKAAHIVEKAVDVMLAVDLVTMAQNDEYDAAYILSADGDFTHAAKFSRGTGKKVFAMSAGKGAALAGAVNSFIGKDPAWFESCKF